MSFALPAATIVTNIILLIAVINNLFRIVIHSAKKDLQKEFLIPSEIRKINLILCPADHLPLRYTNHHNHQCIRP